MCCTCVNDNEVIINTPEHHLQHQAIMCCTCINKNELIINTSEQSPLAPGAIPVLIAMHACVCK